MKEFAWRKSVCVCVVSHVSVWMNVWETCTSSMDTPLAHKVSSCNNLCISSISSTWKSDLTRIEGWRKDFNYSSTAIQGKSSWMWGKEGRDTQYSTTHSHLSSQLPSNALLLSNLKSIGMLCSGYISTSMEIYHYLVLEVKKMNFFKIGLPPVGPAGRSGRGWAGWAREGYQMGIYTPSPMSCPLPKSQ